MKKILLGLVLAAGSIFAGPRISVGIGFGAPAPYYAAPVYAPPVYAAPVYGAYARPIAPGPGYVWSEGYYVRGAWVPGYWRAPVRIVRPVVVPRYVGRPYYGGYRYYRHY